MGNRYGNYKVRRASVGRYLQGQSGIPIVEVEECGHIKVPWGRAGYVTSSRVREVWARELRAHKDDESPYFVVQRIGDWDIDESMVHINLRHFAEILGGYYEARHMQRQKAGE